MAKTAAYERFLKYYRRANARRYAKPEGKYVRHRLNAKQRGIPFQLTFEEWWSIWQKSGHWHERGHGGKHYVMARFGDKGPYAIDNVKIITNDENMREWELTPEMRAKLRESHLGHKDRIAAAQRRALKARAQPKPPRPSPAP